MAAAEEGQKMSWQCFKKFLGEKFHLDKYSSFTNGEKLQSWSASDVDSFIASDPIHGPALKSAREGAKIAALGSAIGAISTGGWAWKYSKSPHGAVLALGAGAVFGWTMGTEIANHTLQLYRLDTMAAQIKFMEWRQKKTAAQSIDLRFS